MGRRFENSQERLTQGYHAKRMIDYLRMAETKLEQVRCKKIDAVMGGLERVRTRQNDLVNRNSVERRLEQQRLYRETNESAADIINHSEAFPYSNPLRSKSRCSQEHSVTSPVAASRQSRHSPQISPAPSAHQFVRDSFVLTG